MVVKAGLEFQRSRMEQNCPFRATLEKPRSSRASFPHLQSGKNTTYS